MKTYCRLIVVVVTLIALQTSAVTIHRSFRTREAGVGFGTGTAGVAYPVDAKIDKAIDEARQKEAEKTKIIIGKCTRVSDGDTIHVVTDGNEKFKVRLDRIDAPEKDQPHGKESAAYLTSLIRGKTVRVEWVKKDQYGRILGIVYLPSIEQSEQSNNSSGHKPDDGRHRQRPPLQLLRQDARLLRGRIRGKREEAWPLGGRQCHFPLSVAQEQEKDVMYDQVYKRIDDALWKDAGCGSELDYVEQSSWILFLKWLSRVRYAEQDSAELNE